MINDQVFTKPPPPSFTPLTAFILFAFSLAVIMSMLVRASPFE